MNNIFSQLAGKASRVIKHWWLYLVCGILSVAAFAQHRLVYKPAPAVKEQAPAFFVLHAFHPWGHYIENHSRADNRFLCDSGCL